MAMLLRWQIDAVRWPISAVAAGCFRLLTHSRKLRTCGGSGLTPACAFAVENLRIARLQLLAVNVDEDPTVAALQLQPRGSLKSPIILTPLP